MCIVLVYIV